MTKPITTRTILRTSVLLSAAASAVFSYLALANEYEIPLHQFTRNGIFLPFALGLAAFGILLSAVVAVHDRKVPDGAPSSTHPAILFTGVLSAFLLFASFIFGMMNRTAATSTLATLADVCAALTAAYLFLAVSRKGSPSITPFLALAGILFGLLSVLQTYFSETLPINAWTKTSALLVFIAVMLFFTAEARTALGKSSPGRYLFFSGTAAVTCIAFGVSRSIPAVSDSLALGDSLIDTIAILAIGLFAACRFLTFRENEINNVYDTSDKVCDSDGKEGEPHA